jgi:hypothetical protein
MFTKFNVEVNKNKTKEGIKLKFTLPQDITPEKKNEVSQKLYNRLTNILEPKGLRVNIDNDQQFSNTLSFFISLLDIKSMIKNALKGEEKDG